MHTTDAHTLQEILRIVNAPDSGGSLAARWEKALGAKPGNIEFAARHAEVVDILATVSRQVMALPETRRVNYQPSIPEWWKAVMGPDYTWGSGNASTAIIGEEHIAVLGSLGDVIEARMGETAASPGGFNIVGVREQCAEWLATIQDAGLPANLTSLLTQGIEHLMWLIDNADRFGYASVARAAETVTGQLAMAAPHVPDEKRKTWKERFTNWAGTLLAFSAFMAATDLAIEETKDVYHEIEPGVDQVIDLVDGDDEPGDDEPVAELEQRS